MQKSVAVRSLFLLTLFISASRLLGSGFFQIETVADPGETVGGGVLTSVGVESSVGSGGEIVFSGVLEEGGMSGEIAMVGRPGGEIARISAGGLDGRHFEFLQISETGAAIGREVNGASQAIRIYNWKEPVETMTAISTDSGLFDFVTFPTMAADANFTFVGRTVFAPDVGLFVNGLAEEKAEVGIAGYRPFAANGGNCVVRSGDESDGRIAVYLKNESVVADASTAKWNRLGWMAGMSEGGDALAFYGEKTGADAGVFVALRVNDGPDYQEPLKVSDLTVTGGVAVGFEAAGFELSEDGRRVGCSVDGDVLTLVFVGTPDAGSVGTTYLVDGETLTIGAEAAVWMMRVALEGDAIGGWTMRPDLMTELYPIVQIGDMVAGEEVTSLFLYDPLAGCEVVAFHVGTADGGRILRARRCRSDCDGDGFPDVLELAMGSLLDDAESLPEMVWEMSEVEDGTSLSVSFSRVIGSGVEVEQSTDLMNWSKVAEFVTGLGGAGEEVTAATRGGADLFLRIRLKCSD